MLIHDLEKISLKDWILTKLQQLGQVCSVMVALIWTLQLLFKIATICITCKQDGSSPASKLLYVYLMKDHMIYKELHQMRKENNSEKLMQDEDQL